MTDDNTPTSNDQSVAFVVLRSGCPIQIPMASIENAPKASRYFMPAVLLFCLAIGAFLRLDQLTTQVLIEDEWHAVHQLIYYTPKQMVSTFGNADYSIPLVLFYWLQMNWWGVSELTLRQPSLLAGLATVIALPAALRGRLDDRILALFALLLSLSPFLVSYSRIARPYAVTLLGVYVALWCLERATRNGAVRWSLAAAYSVLCAIVVWTHPVTGPMLLAPLIALWWTALRGKRKSLPFRPLIILTGLTGVLMALAVLPPLFGDPTALAGKMDVDSVDLNTLIGATHLWFGTSSAAVALACLGFVAAGWTVIWRATAAVGWVVLGLALTCLVLLVARPWWVNQPLAFGRYLLPAVPLLLLAVAAGVVRAGDAALRLKANDATRPAWLLALVGSLLVIWWMNAPLAELLKRPNSYTQHSFYQLDYRIAQNPMRAGLHSYPVSPFWVMLSSAPPGTITVAVAPFRYATYEWPAPLWERESRQRVIPAYLWGTCEANLPGEVPPDARFRFVNGVHIKDKDRLMSTGIDYLAFYKTIAVPGRSPPKPHCEAWMREHYGAPYHEDAALVVWKIRNAAVAHSNAQSPTEDR